MFKKRGKALTQSGTVQIHHGLAHIDADLPRRHRQRRADQRQAQARVVDLAHQQRHRRPRWVQQQRQLALGAQRPHAGQGGSGLYQRRAEEQRIALAQGGGAAHIQVGWQQPVQPVGDRGAKAGHHHGQRHRQRQRGDHAAQRDGGTVALVPRPFHRQQRQQPTLHPGADPVQQQPDQPGQCAPIAEAPKAPAPIAEAVPAGAVPPEEKKKGGRPSAKSMEGTTFRPDLGPGDNWLYNTAGPDRRKAILAEFNEGKPAKDYETAQKLYKKYQEKYPKDLFGPVIPVEQAKARGIKPPENYGQLGKVAKVGGVAGLALTAAEMANAAQKSSKGNDAPLRESIFNLLGMIPGLGTAFSAGTYSGGTNENEAAELARRRQMPPTITKR